MPFTATTFNSGAAPGIDAPTLNAMQTQYTEATNSFEQDLYTPWVFSGLVATKDGTTATQLDVTAGIAFPLQTDNTLRRRAPTSTTFSTVGHASATMYLDLNPDGSWSWNTSHSAVANYLAIASVTTDAAANIATVTDARVLNTTWLGSRAGVVNVGTPHLTALYSDGGSLTSDGSGNVTIAGGTIHFQSSDGAYIQHSTTNNWTEYKSSASGAASGHVFSTWNGSVEYIPFSIGGRFASATVWLGNAGDFNGQTFIANAPANASYFTSNIPSTTSDQNAVVDIIDATSGAVRWQIGKQSHANGDYFRVIDATHGVTGIGVQPNGTGLNGSGIAGYAIPMTRNGSQTSFPIYTGTGTPSSPPTGSVWIQA